MCKKYIRKKGNCCQEKKKEGKLSLENIEVTLPRQEQESHFLIRAIKRLVIFLFFS